MSEEKRKEEINIKKEIIAKAKEIIANGKEGEPKAKVTKVGLNYFIMLPVGIREYENYLMSINAGTFTSEDEDAFLKKHILHPENFDLTKINAGTYERIKDGIFMASGFNDIVSVIYDETVVNLREKLKVEDVEKITKEVKEVKIIRINNVLFAIKPITRERYKEYRISTDELGQIPIGERFKKQYEIDRQLTEEHMISPNELPEEAGYLESVYRALMQTSGFQDEVDIVNVEDV